MNNVDKQYNAMLRDILEFGKYRENRTGVGSYSLFKYDMSFDLREGFPLLTSRRMPYKAEIVELEGFKNGVTDKKWYKDNDCPFWNPFANPEKAPYDLDEDSKKAMENEDDLGPLGYSHGWRNFGGDYEKYLIGVKTGVDQLAILVEKIRNQIDDRRLIVSAWDVTNMKKMALPPCHYTFKVYLSPCGEFIDLKFTQRSVDAPLGWAVPKYATLLHLLANECGRSPRMLHACYEDAHIYENQVEVVKEQLLRGTFSTLPTFKLLTDKFTDIFDWTHKCYEISGYKNSGVLKYPSMAV